MNGTIDLGPTWESLLEVYVEMASSTGAFNPRYGHRKGDVGLAWAQLRKMARAADAYRKLQKAGVFLWAGQIAHEETCPGRGDEPHACTCGLDEVKKAIREMGAIP